MISKNVTEYREKFNQSFEEAQKLLNDMKEVIHNYGDLTIADFHELVNSIYRAKPRWDIVIPQIVHDVTSIDHAIVPSVMSEEVFPPRRIKNYSEESSRRHPRRSGKYPFSYAVDHPQHYQSEAGLEVIDVIDAFTDGLDGIEAFDTGNIIKYICRWKKKNGIEDLEKAKWYLENLIKNVKEKENEDAK